MDTVDRVPKLRARAAWLKQRMADLRVEHRQYIHEHGEDMPSVRDWKWPAGTAG